MLKIILKHAPNYLGASSIASIAALLMTKYYTNVFSPSEFGILSLYLILFQYIATFSSLNLDTSASRLYFDYKENLKNEYLSTVFILITILSIFIFIVGLIFINPISNWISPNSKKLYIVTFIASIFSVYVNYLTRILYNENKSKSVLKHSIFQTFFNHSLSVLFISFFNFGIFGRLSGQGLGYFLNIIFLLKEFYSKNLFKIKIYFNKNMAKETFFLALPAIITSIQTILFVYVDRIFIKYYLGDTSVGVYTLGYILGQGLAMIYEAISKSILPKIYNDFIENYNLAIKDLENFAYKYYLGLIIVTLLLVIISPFIVKIISNENYLEASKVMPFILVGFMMGGFYKIPALVLGFHKIIWFYPILAFFVFLINIIFNWILIPINGIYGAAFSTFFGYYFNSLIIFLMSKKYFSKNLFNFVISMYFVVALVSFFIFFY